MQFKCKECGRDFKSRRSLHTHVKAHDLFVGDYYVKYYPRFDKLTNQYKKPHTNLGINVGKSLRGQPPARQRFRYTVQFADYYLAVHARASFAVLLKCSA